MQLSRNKDERSLDRCNTRETGNQVVTADGRLNTRLGCDKSSSFYAAGGINNLISQQPQYHEREKSLSYSNGVLNNDSNTPQNYTLSTLANSSRVR